MQIVGIVQIVMHIFYRYIRTLEDWVAIQRLRCFVQFDNRGNAVAGIKLDRPIWLDIDHLGTRYSVPSSSHINRQLSSYLLRFSVTLQLHYGAFCRRF